MLAMPDGALQAGLDGGQDDGSSHGAGRSPSPRPVREPPAFLDTATSAQGARYACVGAEPVQGFLSMLLSGKRRERIALWVLGVIFVVVLVLAKWLGARR
jgi:hypothetical protein